MSSRRLFTFAVLLATALLTAAPAVAAPVAWSKIEVTSHGEPSGATTMLVSGTLPDTAKLPADVELTLPSGAQVQWAGEILGGPVQNDPTVKYTKSSSAGQDVYRFRLAKSRTAQIEAAVPAVVVAEGGRYSAALRWTPSQSVPELNMNVRVPRNADVQRVPGATLQASNEAQYSYYSKSFRDVEAGKQVDFSFTYAAATAAGPAAGTAPGPGSSTPMVVLLLGAAVVGFAVIVMNVSKKMREAQAETEVETKTAAAAKTRPRSAKKAEPVPAAAAPAPPAGRKMKPAHVILGCVLLVIAAMVVSLTSTIGPGTKKTDGNVVTKTVSTAKADSTATFDIELKEGGDPKHEADHVFEALQLPGIATASFDAGTKKLEVRFDDAATDEAAIRQQLAQAGYVKVTAADAVAAQLSADGKTQQLTVKAADKLDPSLIRAKAGIPLRLTFGQGTNHLVSIKIPALGIEKALAKGGATVEIAKPQAGTYQILCSEDYADGTLIVE